jgi:class 3 adenylate cyclase
VGNAQTLSAEPMTWVDSMIYIIHPDPNIDSGTKSQLADSAFQISVRGRDLCRQLQLRVIQATYLDNRALADSALTLLYWARDAYQEPCDSMILMSIFSNLTNIYLSLEEIDRIDSVSRIALDLWNPSWKDVESRLAILNNYGIARAYAEDTIGASLAFHKAYRESVAASNQGHIQKTLINLGSLKGMIGELDSAYYFFNAASLSARDNKDMDSYMTLLINLANLDIAMKRYQQAMTLLDSAYAIADTLKSVEKMASVQRVKADLFAKQKKYEDAFNYLSEFMTIREQYLNEERVKAVTEMSEKYQSAEKARQIQQLELEKLDASLENERIRNARNRITYVGIVVLLFAVGLYSRLRYVRKSRTAIQKEKDISERLLLNILPAAVAEELKEKGFAEAKHYSTATILFSDFKSFTSISEELTAVELVDEINACFKAFDEIITKFGIEKIKTIGDAYMAAGGITGLNTATPTDTVMAAIEMQRFIIARKKERDAQALPAFEMRIGIHTGPVVAGIVGVKKFQYDLWGDTVNIASRLESNSEPGHVNISEATYEYVRDNPSLVCTSRGLIQVKGKGEMQMYFVDLA